MEELKSMITIVAYGVESFGVVIIVVGSVASTISFLIRLRGESPKSIYHKYRRGVGRSIILGLEFLIAGDIIRTVIVSDTLANVAVLGLIILIRSFLSVTIQPIGIPARSLNPAIDFFALVMTGFCPVISASSSTARSNTFASATASPSPIFTTILLSFGTAMRLL